MVKTQEDLTGRVFGRLTVLRQGEDYVNPKGIHYARWICQCECGSEPKSFNQADLKRGHVVSCGCLQLEIKSTIIAEKIRKVCNYSEKLFDEHGAYYIGYATNTNNPFYVDEDDFDKVKNCCWTESVVANGFHKITTNHNGKTTPMHKFLGYKNYDHIDRNELNNRKYNLRPCSISQNAMNRTRRSDNTSGIIGVSFHIKTQTWHARISIDKKEKTLGYFESKAEAIKARLVAEKEHYGEFAPQQHLFEQYGI